MLDRAKDVARRLPGKVKEKLLEQIRQIESYVGQSEVSPGK